LLCNGNHAQGYKNLVSGSRPFNKKSRKAVKEPLRERVRDAASDAAQNAPEKMRDIATQAAQNAPERMRGIAESTAQHTPDRVKEIAAQAAQNAPEQYRRLRKAASELDVKWARSKPAIWVRENFMQFVLKPLMNYYASRRAEGSERLLDLKDPVILVANHTSHMDTPVILSALPRPLRKRTAVVAAADYFYNNRLTAWLASLAFNTVPVDRRGGSGVGKGGSHLDTILDDGWNLLLYPNGSRHNNDGRLRRGAAVMAETHHRKIVPIIVQGTAEAMPPGQGWPKRLRGKFFSRRHKIEVRFGDPITPEGDVAATIERVQEFFDAGKAANAKSLYRRRED
jgi:1-acyl-sn-glycerol-3-phosphate acyltransferase